MPSIPSSAASPSRIDEDYINRSLLDSLNADAEPMPSGSDSDTQAYGSAPASSSPGSASNLYHIPMQSHQQPPIRPDSPSHNDNNNFLPPHLQSQQMPEALYNMQPHQQSAVYQPNPDYSSDGEQRQHPAKMDGYGPVSALSYRGSAFASFANNARARHLHSSVAHSNNFRDGNAPYFSSPADYPPHVSPKQSHMQAFDPRGSFDYGSSPLSSGPNHKSFGLDNYGSNGLSSAALPPHHASGKPAHNMFAHAPYNGGTQYASQTPYGPHVPVSSGLAAPAVNGALHGASASGHANGVPAISSQEEISTIFVVGFPDDMQEREFQNMFTFSPGFEAATLKIPNREFTSYGGSAGQGGLRSGGPNGTFGTGYSGPNDPYNLVTVNQGGVVVDSARDGTLASWPSMQQDDSANHFAPSGGPLPPRKQIIGFAKFRSRDEALQARDVLQGRRVDIEKGAVLKAEMAKKNLHTKRGVGPLPGLGGAPGGGPGPDALRGSMSHNIMNGSNDHHYGGDIARDRDGGYGIFSGRMSQWREQLEPGREEEDRRDGSAALGFASGTRGAKERAEEDERERRRQRQLRLRAGNQTAYDAFHSAPISRHGSQVNGTQGVLSPPPSTMMLAPQDGGHGLNGFASPSDEPVGPWDNLRQSAFVGSLPIGPPSSGRSPSPSIRTNPDVQRPYSPSFEAQSQAFGEASQPRDQQQRHSHSGSSASSVAGGSQSSKIGRTTNTADQNLTQAMNNLAVSTTRGDTSPQLPSPSSGSSGSGHTRNIVDQNPPINTLYVGNLPSSPSSPGYPQDHLEECLRQLFEVRPGFKNMSFRHKSNGPMCFVEFEDVDYATKALHELYGHTLDGMIKGGGLRLSYSKNPLGVRTPTSAGSSGVTMQQQQQQAGLANGISDAFNRHLDDQARPTILRREMAPQSSTASNTFSPYMMSSPPPRFFSPPASSTSFGLAPSAPLAGPPSTFMPRSNGNIGLAAYGLSGGADGAPPSFSPFGLATPPHSTIPDHLEQSQHERQQQHYLHPPSTNSIEATRAG